MIPGVCGIAVFSKSGVNLSLTALSAPMGAVSMTTANHANVDKVPSIAGMILSYALLIIRLFVVEMAHSLTAMQNTVPDQTMDGTR